MIKNFLRGSKKGINLTVLFFLLNSVSVLAYDCDREMLPKKQDLDNYSFDFSSHKLPIAYDTYGSAV